ncbi:MAG: hypothetical protein VXX95_03925 [Candidatus Thermoplasmatota archaeon]|nr:hypothetical protein [Candidatus Thermoplasmatota archaeon]MEC8625726.1 hypothetical protein [Candidatus Thermoplasmatota archaeon]MEC8709101.1 hypothetical protein [Candidatus Thermoplasmatota archaeon]MEC8742175.1 hypothetical protein [Candidatus Thermoplasmatota archaeon]
MQPDGAGGPSLVGQPSPMIMGTPMMLPKTDANVALGLSIGGLVLTFLAGGLGIVLSIVGLVFAYNGRKVVQSMPGHPDRQKITASLVLGWLGIILPVIAIIGFVVVLMLVANSHAMGT